MAIGDGADSAGQLHFKGRLRLAPEGQEFDSEAAGRILEPAQRLIFELRPAPTVSRSAGRPAARETGHLLPAARTEANEPIGQLCALPEALT